MPLLDELKYQHNFTNTEMYLADYILKSMDEVIEMTLQQLSAASFVSRPTIIRFYKKLGFKSYYDFRLELELQMKRSGQKFIDSNKPFDADASYMEIAETVTILTKQVADSCRDLLDEKVLTEAVELLYSSKRIFLYALGDCYIDAESFIYRLTKLNIYATMLNNYSYPLVNLHNIRKEDCIIVISTTGKTLKLESRTIKMIADSPARTILITSNVDPDYQKMFDLILKVYHGEDEVVKIGSLASQLSVIYILNVLYSCIYQIDYERNKEIIETYSDYLKKENLI